MKKFYLIFYISGLFLVLFMSYKIKNIETNHKKTYYYENGKVIEIGKNSYQIIIYKKKLK